SAPPRRSGGSGPRSSRGPCRRDAKPLSPAEAIGIRIMQVQVRRFATYRQIVGAGQLAWTLRDGTTVGQDVEAVLAKSARPVGHGNSMLLEVKHEVVRP